MVSADTEFFVTVFRVHTFMPSLSHAAKAYSYGKQGLSSYDSDGGDDGYSGYTYGGGESYDYTSYHDDEASEESVDDSEEDDASDSELAKSLSEATIQ